MNLDDILQDMQMMLSRVRKLRSDIKEWEVIRDSKEFLVTTSLIALQDGYGIFVSKEVILPLLNVHVKKLQDELITLESKLKRMGEFL